MPDDVAPSNVNRSISLAGTSIAIFTFTLTFLFPRTATGEVNAAIFQVALGVMAVATFSFLVSTLEYYSASLAGPLSNELRGGHLRRGQTLWFIGYTLLFLAPSLILVSVGLLIVGGVWVALWLVYLLVAARYIPRYPTADNSAGAP